MELRESRRMILMNAPHKGSAGGSIVTFKPGMEKTLLGCNVNIDPVQNLHGQANAYPAGGGKNIFNCQNFTILFKNAYADTATISSDGTGVTVYKASSATGTPFVYIDLFEITSAHVGKKYYISASYTVTPTYAVALATLDADGENRSRKSSYYTIVEGDIGKHLGFALYGKSTEDSLEYTKVQVEEDTAVTAWAPYENMCPITGWAGVNLNKTGRNVVDYGNLTYTTQKYIDADGSIQSNTSYKYCNEYIKVKPSTIYTVQYNKTASATVFTVALYTKHKEFIVRYIPVYSSITQAGYNTGTFETTSDTEYMRFSLYQSSTDVQIEEGSVDHTYESFGSTIGIPFRGIGDNLFDKNSTSKAWVDVNNNITTRDDAKSCTISVTPGETVTLSADVNASTNYVYLIAFLNSSDALVSRHVATSGNELTQTVPATAVKCITGISRYDQSGITDPQFRSNTVYGGNLNVLTGVLSVTWIGVKASNLTWDATNADSVFMTTLPYDRKSETTNIISDRYKTVSTSKTMAQMDSYSVKGNANNLQRLYVRDMRYDNYSDWLDDNGDAFFVYELDSPQTHQLTAAQVKTLTGTNNIWSDTGDTTVQFWTH